MERRKRQEDTVVFRRSLAGSCRTMRVGVVYGGACLPGGGHVCDREPDKRDPPILRNEADRNGLAFYLMRRGFGDPPPVSVGERAQSEQSCKKGLPSTCHATAVPVGINDGIKSERADPAIFFGV